MSPRTPRKPLTLVTLALGLILAARLGLASTGLAGEGPVLAADIWHPYSCEDPARPGFLTEIASQALASRGHDPSYTVRPWSRAIMEARAGRVDGLIGSPVGELPDFIYPECNLGTSRTTFYVRPGTDWHYAGVESLEGQRVGIVEGYPYGEPLDTEIREHPERFAKSWGEGAVVINLRALAAGRVGIVAEDPLAVEEFLRETGQPGLFVAAGALEEALRISVAFQPASPRSKEYAADLCAGIKDLERTGKLKEILQRYGLSRWP
jgi:polar amino acid transport system substrate-binding protein